MQRILVGAERYLEDYMIYKVIRNIIVTRVLNDI